MNLELFDRTPLEWIAPSLFFGGVLIDLFFQLFFYLRLLFLKRSTENIFESPISVCLSVRNEEERIDQLLDQLLGQQYANFEVIVVDDYSEDCTLQKIGQWAKKDPRLKYTIISQETRFSEKLAINLALKASHSDRAIFVRPDASAITPQYLKKVNDCAGDSSLLINYSNFKVERSIYNKYCRMERFLLFLKSAAYSVNGLPIVYHENNILFKKDVYFESDGFRGKMNNHYANLELVFNRKIKGKVSVSVDPETIIREDASLGRRDFSELMHKQLRLKQDLPFGKRLLLLIENLGRILFLVGFCWLLITEPHHWFFVVLPAVFIMMLQLFIIKSMSARLNEEKIFLSSFVYIFVRPVIQLYFASKIYIIDKRNKWN